MPHAPNLVTLLNPVFNAAHDCGPLTDAICFEGTRVEVVESIKQWERDPSGRQIGWLTGPAGYGKSTIARTVALQWDLDKILAASYFFLRHSDDRSKGARLLPTLAFQLTLTIPETKQAIEEALVQDPTLLKRNLGYQFQKLLINPISALPQKDRRTMFIVIDALDECDDHDFISQLVKLITKIDYSTFFIRFLFSSRRDGHVNRAFEHSPNSMTYHLSLSDVDANPDIKIFLKSRFDDIHTENPLVMANIPKPWPSPSDLDEIVEKVNRSFIFAATLVKYIGTGEVPPERLKSVVETHTGVDGTYVKIIKEFWDDEHFQTVFSTIMLLQRPFSVTELGTLLNLERSEILIEILKIQSVLIHPRDDDTPVDIVHTSLREFSICPTRAGGLCVETPAHHLFIAERCLKVMLANPRRVVFDKDPMKYAASYWYKHLRLTLNADSCSLPYDSLVDSLEKFARQAADTWSNTFILNGHEGDFDESSIDDISHAVKVSPHLDHSTLSILLAEMPRPPLASHAGRSSS